LCITFISNKKDWVNNNKKPNMKQLSFLIIYTIKLGSVPFGKRFAAYFLPVCVWDSDYSFSWKDP